MTRSDHDPRGPIAAILFVAAALAAVVALATYGDLSNHPSTPHNPEAALQCNDDAKIVEIAVIGYNDTPPRPCTKDTCRIGLEHVGRAAGDIRLGDPTSYATSRYARLLLKSHVLPAWPENPYFAISLTATAHPGEAMVYIPRSSHHGVLFDRESAGTACNSL